MGELSGGRSAISPTRSRSTSRRTRIEWQYSQVVWTALDQRNLIGAPQFGQLATLSLMAIRPLDSPDVHRGGAEFALEVSGKVPIGSRLATKHVQTDGLVFWKSMTGKVRFSKQAQAGDPASGRKLMPHRLAHGTQDHRGHQVGEERAQFLRLCQPGAVAAVRFDHPLDSWHAYESGFPHSGQNFELRG